MARFEYEARTRKITTQLVIRIYISLCVCVCVFVNLCREVQLRLYITHIKLSLAFELHKAKLLIFGPPDNKALAICV